MKNLVGRVGRAGKETKGFVIVPHKEDFPTMTNLIKETSIRPVCGQLFNLIRPLSDALVQLRIPITAEVLDSLEGPFSKLLEAIDISIIDLLSEEVTLEELSSLIRSLVVSTFSYIQSDETQRNTLESIFVHRAKKLEPALSEGYFPLLKKSGAPVELFNEIRDHFDFNNAMWTTEGLPTERAFVDFILTNGVLSLPSVAADLKIFNDQNRSGFTLELVRDVAVFWMQGAWFGSLCDLVGCEMHQLLRLLNVFFSYSLQRVLSCVIRLAEDQHRPGCLSQRMLDWPSMLQYGLDSETKLNIFELGLTDREAIIHLDHELNSRGYLYQNYAFFKRHLLEQPDLLFSLAKRTIPAISLRNLERFLRNLSIESMLGREPE